MIDSGMSSIQTSTLIPPLLHVPFLRGAGSEDNNAALNRRAEFEMIIANHRRLIIAANNALAGQAGDNKNLVTTAAGEFDETIPKGRIGVVGGVVINGDGQGHLAGLANKVRVRRIRQSARDSLVNQSRAIRRIPIINESPERAGVPQFHKFAVNGDRDNLALMQDFVARSAAENDNRRAEMLFGVFGVHLVLQCHNHTIPAGKPKSQRPLSALYHGLQKLRLWELVDDVDEMIGDAVAS